MELALAFVLGGLCGWLLGRFVGNDRSDDPRTFRPNKRQRKILATLPPDPERPSIEALVQEEAQELGVDRIPGGETIPLGIRLKVWKRDHESAGPCDDQSWHFVVEPPPTGAPVTADQVRLECRQDDHLQPSSGNS
ncbi:MAG TPA: hypothetical protein VLG28_18290 [Acidimicrobiia bacterium]|nr:hypothetical protein [Acidimicrobiia bacterium]